MTTFSDFKIKYINCHENIPKNGIDYFDQNNPYVNCFEKYDSSVIFFYFNASIAYLGNDLFIYLLRRNINLFPSNTIKPGNSPRCINHFEIGNNFHWNQWSAFEDETIILIGNHYKNIFNVPKIYVEESSDFDICYDLGKYERHGKTYYQSTNILKKADMRVYVKDNNVLIYVVDELTPLTIWSYEYDMTSNSLFLLDRYVIKGEKNASIINFTINSDSDQFIHIDWFYANGKYKYEIPGVYLWNTIQMHDRINEKTNAIIIPFEKNHIISGLGSYMTGKEEDKEKFGLNYGVIPLLSVGTPHVKYNSLKLGDCYIGVGHIKIHTDNEKYKYQPESNIHYFRENLHQEFKKRFGERYIRHNGTGKAWYFGNHIKEPKVECKGYIYMMYFYIITQDFSNMYLSDAFLPINLDKALKEDPKNYVFSLFFPSGLTKYGNQLIVSGGEGDYRPIFLEFNIEDAVNKCIHDIKKMDFNNYNYYILAMKGGNIYTKKKLSDILEQSGGNHKYHSKYMKYKTKYLKLKNNKW